MMGAACSWPHLNPMISSQRHLHRPSLEGWIFNTPILQRPNSACRILFVHPHCSEPQEALLHRLYHQAPFPSGFQLGPANRGCQIETEGPQKREVRVFVSPVPSLCFSTEGTAGALWVSPTAAHQAWFWGPVGPRVATAPCGWRPGCLFLPCGFPLALFTL